MTKQRHILWIAAAVLTGGLLSGCANQTDLIKEGRITLKPRIDRVLRRLPEVYEDKADLVVAGRLERGLPRDLGGHIDVTAIAPDGTTVFDARLNYEADTVSSPGAPPPRHGSFRRVHAHRYGSYPVYSVRFRGVPPVGSVVKVRYEPEPHRQEQFIRMELLGFSGCPFTPRLRSNTRAAMSLVPGRWVLDEVNQETLDPGDLRRGWPAPTLLVNGRDLFGMPDSAGSAMGCRVYEGGVPSPEQIAKRLRTLNGEEKPE